MPSKVPHCFYCERTAQDVPLLSLMFKDQNLHICPQHMPILIHDPAQLAGKLQGAENLSPASDNDH